MKMNNKGITTIEVIVCFVLISIITISIYTTVYNFNEKKIIEGYKEEIYDYKNILTKDIQDDFIKIGLANAKYEKTTEGRKNIYTVTCVLKDGTTRKLVVEQLLAKSSYHIEGAEDSDDYFMIKYGKSDDLIEYPIPELGYSENESGHKVQDLSINTVSINIDSENVLSIYIGFYHPDLDTKYGISIVSPINYTFSGTEATTPWNY